MTEKIITNHQPRELLDGHELTAREREEFDYIDNIAEEYARFFRYRGNVYDLHEFSVWDNPASPTRAHWDGYRSDSYFSGIVIKYPQEEPYISPDYERVIVGLYLC